MATLPTAATARDLSDAEFAELDELLADAPEPLSPFDAVMLDGFLCGVLVQPVLLAPGDWLPYAFDMEGQPLPDDVDPAWRERTTALIQRPGYTPAVVAIRATSDVEPRRGTRGAAI